MQNVQFTSIQSIKKGGFNKTRSLSEDKSKIHWFSKLICIVLCWTFRRNSIRIGCRVVETNKLCASLKEATNTKQGERSV